MADLQTKLVTEYRKINGELVKVLPETISTNVFVPIADYEVSGEQSAPATLSAVLSNLDSRIDAITALDALVFRGVVDGSHALPVSGYEVGDVYRVAAAGTFAGQVCEIGDIITCVATDGQNSDWVITQTNIDGAVVGPASVVNNRIAVFDGTTGKLIKDGGMTIAELQAEIDSDVAAHADIDATGSVSGHVTLSDATNSTSGAADSVAATPAAVKAAKDAADAAQAAIDAHDDVEATASVLGHVYLSDAINGTEAAASDATAATPKAVADAINSMFAYSSTVPTDATDVSDLSEGATYLVLQA